jgi:hypothetical protein
MSTPSSMLTARKQLLIARLRLQRTELALHAGAARESLRPASLVANAIVKPAALVTLFELVAPILGLKRFAKWARLASVVFAVSRVVRAPKR